MPLIIFSLNLYANIPIDLKKDCKADKKESCNDIGVLYQMGKEIKKDYQKAKIFYIKACNLESANGCRNLGDLYSFGQGVELDYSKAEIYYIKAYRVNNDGESCNSLGELYSIESWEEYNLTKSRTYYNKSCKLDNQDGCDGLQYILNKIENIKVKEEEYILLKKELDESVQEAELLEDI